MEGCAKVLYAVAGKDFRQRVLHAWGLGRDPSKPHGSIFVSPPMVKAAISRHMYCITRGPLQDKHWMLSVPSEPMYVWHAIPGVASTLAGIRGNLAVMQDPSIQMDQIPIIFTRAWPHLHGPSRITRLIWLSSRDEGSANVEQIVRYQQRLGDVPIGDLGCLQKHRGMHGQAVQCERETCSPFASTSPAHEDMWEGIPCRTT